MQRLYAHGTCNMRANKGFVLLLSLLLLIVLSVVVVLDIDTASMEAKMAATAQQ